MFCTNCGKEIKGNLKFCTGCGKALNNKVDIPKQKVETPDSAPIPNIKSALEEDFIKLKINLKLLIVGSILVAGLIIVFAIVFSSGQGTNNKTSATSNNQSVVDILCNNGESGSGTIFTADGTVLTNNHVIAGATSCQVTIPNSTTGGIEEIYVATPIVTPTISKKYDIATVKIDGSYTDSNGKIWGTYPTTFSPFVLPSTCSTSTPSNLGDSVKIYGYPVTSGGLNLTETDGIVSSFANGGDILTSAKIDSGNSGGLAVDQNGCWLGIPSAVISGNYQNLGVIIPGSVVQNILSNVPAKYEPTVSDSGANALVPAIASDISSGSSETNAQICQDSFGDNSEYNGSSNSAGQPYCQCKSGYTWDGSGNACATETSLQQSCQNTYGEGSYTYEQNQKAMCGCSTGYQWNSAQTECVAVQETGYQVCADMNATWDGSSYASDGSYSCTCDAGYTSSDNGKSCVIAPQESNDQQCQDQYGIDSDWTGQTNSSGGPTCGCQSGYTWNSAQTECVSGLSYCENLDGYGASYDRSTNSCTCDSGYIYSGGQCEIGSLYCSNNYGVGSEYDYSTGGCECMAGYTSNGSECVMDSYNNY